MSNPFEVFDLDPSYSLDLKVLDKTYFNLQRAFHPDKKGAQNTHHKSDVKSSANRSAESLHAIPAKHSPECAPLGASASSTANGSVEKAASASSTLSSTPQSSAPPSQLSSSAINMAYQTLKDPLSRAKSILCLLGIDIEDTMEETRTSESTLLSDMLSFQEAMMMCEDEEEADAIQEELDEHLIKAQHAFSDSFDRGDHDALMDIYIQMVYLSRLKSQMKEIESRFFNRPEEAPSIH